jgi:hypothetical protein
MVSVCFRNSTPPLQSCSGRARIGTKYFCSESGIHSVESAKASHVTPSFVP